MNERLKEVLERLGSRPSLIRMGDISDYFGEDAPYRTEDGVAFVNISGPLSNSRWSWGGTTYGDIQNQIRIAAADPGVKGILLNVNSPGGETDNAFETAAMIAAAGKAKPVWAVAATGAYSAAYLLASQASKIYLAPTSGGVGSIGVYCGHMDYSGMLDQMGIKVTLISAGEGKTAGNPWEPLTDAAKADIQSEMDRLYGAFVGGVAAGRGMNAGDVVALGARIYEGSKAAIAAGLADAPGDIETAWVDLCNEIQRGSSAGTFLGRRAAAAAKEKNGMKNEATAAAPDLEAIAEQAKKEAQANVAMINDLCALAGKPELVAGFIGAGKSSAQVRTELLKLKADAQTETDLNSGIMPGADADTAGKQKATAWNKVCASLGIRTKGQAVQA